MHRILGSLLFGLALSLVFVFPALPAAPAGPTNEDCLGCHADKGLSKEVKGKKISLYTDKSALKASTHGGFACTDCHADIKEVPHPEKLAPVSCQNCHPDAGDNLAKSVHGRKDGPQLDCQSCHGAHDVKPAAQLGVKVCATCHPSTVEGWEASVHGKAAAQGVKEAAHCADCHGPTHALLSQEDPGAPTGRMTMAETCGRCHADSALIEKRGIPIPKAFQLYQQSVHGRAVAAGKQAATCADCHGSHAVLRANDPKSSIYRENIPKACAQCHKTESQEYLASIHGTAVAKGVTKSPVCTDCHGEHSIRAAQDPRSRVSVAAVSKTCASCHEAEGISEKYGIPGARASTYADSFHGLAVRGGSKVAANCASCHGVHDIRPSSDPKSAISKENLPTTCGKCHPGAGENFARGSVHLTGTRQDAPILYYVRLFYLLVILGTIGGMSAHNGLDFLKKLRREYRRRSGAAAVTADADHTGEAPRFYLRMSVFERWQHGMLAVSFLVLVYTGFALKFPESWPFAWLVALEGGYAWRAWIHRGAALVMCLACLLHVAYLPTRRGRAHLQAMLPRLSDAQELFQNVTYLVGWRHEPPRFDRFSYIEKAEYWALIWGSVVMAVTGFVLWFENEALRFLPLWALDVATMVHYYEAWLATLAILVWHFYFVIFNPDVYPINWTWLTGSISEEMLQHEHPREYERLTEEEERQAAESQAS